MIDSVDYIFLYSMPFDLIDCEFEDALPASFSWFPFPPSKTSIPLSSLGEVSTNGLSKVTTISILFPLCLEFSSLETVIYLSTGFRCTTLTLSRGSHLPHPISLIPSPYFPCHQASHVY